MRTIDFEAMFVSYVQFWINFHSFKLRISLDTDLIHISIKKVLFDRQKTLSRILYRINNCFCHIPLESVFEVLFKLI